MIKRNVVLICVKYALVTSFLGKKKSMKLFKLELFRRMIYAKCVANLFKVAHESYRVDTDQTYWSCNLKYVLRILGGIK